MSLASISQDTFNRYMTIVLTAFAVAAYTYSQVTGKPVNMESILTFTVPTLNHIVHVFTSSQQAVAQIGQTGGVTNGTSPNTTQPTTPVLH